MKHFLHFLLAIPFALCAQDETAQMHQFEQRLAALEQKAKERPIYNASARPEIAEGYNVYLTAAALYWKAQENGLEYAVKTNDPFHLNPTDKQRIKNPHFEYDIGFRVGLGYNIPHDTWDLFLTWTRFNTDADAHIRTSGDDGLFPIWTSLLDTNAFPMMHAKARWKLNFNLIDGEVGREYFVGRWLSLRPSIGLRTIWIKQHYTVHYDDFFSPLIEDDRVQLVNDYSGIGPKASIDSVWDLRWGLSVYGSGTLSLLYGDFEVRRHENLETLIPQANRFHDDYHLVRAMADLQIGLGWDILFLHDKFHFGLRLGWEQVLFFGQNQLDRLVNSDFAGSIVSNLGDLSFQGGTLSARIDF